MKERCIGFARRTSRERRGRGALLGTALVAGALSLLAPASTSGAATITQSISATCGNWQTFNVPANIISASVTVVGGGAGSGGSNNSAGGNPDSGAGGGGAQVVTTLTTSHITSGQTLSLTLGCGGGAGDNDTVNPSGGTSAYGSGGAGGGDWPTGGGGGGASALCIGDGSCGTPLAVAAGGGGGGAAWTCCGGQNAPGFTGGGGGNPNGANGGGNNANEQGKGATQGAVGAGGTGDGDASSGSGQAGGDGNTADGLTGGGGGGGGYFGGGAGASDNGAGAERGAGGGGGSSYAVGSPTYTVIASKTNACGQAQVVGNSCSTGQGGQAQTGNNADGFQGSRGTATITWTVKDDQTITFTSTAPSGAIVGGPTYNVAASATSGLTVTFASATPGVCSVAGSTVSFVANGTCTINANQAGNATWNPAPQVQQSFNVGRRAATAGVSCTSPIGYDEVSYCTVTVTDTSPGTASAHTGSVALSGVGDGTATFSPCGLAQVSPGVSQCVSSASFTLQDTYAVSVSVGQTTVHQAASFSSTPVSVKARATSTSVSCAPTAVGVGVPTTCTATVADTASGTASAPAGTVTFGFSGGGGLSSPSCSLSPVSGSASSCSTQFSSSTSGNKTVSAAYAGSSSGSVAGGFRHGSSASSSFPVTVTGSVSARHTTSVSASCSPSPVEVGSPTSCTVTVTDTFAFGPTSTPTGTATWGYSGGGSFSPANSCTLVEVTPGLSASCSVSFTPAAPAGNKTVNAFYTGTAAHHNGGSGSVLVVATPVVVPPTVTPTRHATTSSLVCSPTTVALGSPVSCTVTVTDVTTNPDPKSEPVGTVSFGYSGGGSFSPASSCTLVGNGDGVSSSCGVSFTPSGAAGNKTVNGFYTGTAAHHTSGTGSFFIVAT